MKNLSLLFTVFISFSLLLFSSCGDDDKPSGPVTTNANLEGTIWLETSRVASNCANSSNNENSTCTEDCAVILINSNGTIDIADDDGIFTVPYSKSGSNLMVDIGEANPLDISYAITGNTMTITFEEDSCNITEVYTASQSSAIAGTSWGKVGERNENCTDPNGDCEECDFDTQTILLLADGTGTNTNQNGAQEITYTLNGNMVSVEYDDNGQTVSLEFEYKIIGEILVLESADNNGCETTEIYRGS